MKTKITIGEKTYQIEVSEIKEGLIRVRVNNKDWFFTRNELGQLLPIEPSAKDLAGKVTLGEGEVFLEALAEKEIKSPIAGVISSIDVKREQTLKPGQKVATLIAMKMENEIIAETAGTVQEIKVKEGQFVNTGDVLVVLG